jgi:rare lipoprotein A
MKHTFLLTMSLVLSLAALAQDTSKRKANRKVMVGIASWYSNSFEGRKTANGEIFSQSKYTAACNVLPLGTWVKLTNLSNNKTVIVKINDRMHPRMKRLVDLSRAAAAKLNFLAKGLTRVRLEVLGRKKPTDAG